MQKVLTVAFAMCNRAGYAIFIGALMKLTEFADLDLEAVITE